jgi:hypothetical protein
MGLRDNPGYVLRISSDEWRDQVFELKKYYSGIMRNWKRGTTILLVKKCDEGDSFLGYGVVERVEMLWEMRPEEEQYCKENNWKCAISFEPLITFMKPYPIKLSILSDDKRKGMYLHGIKIHEGNVNSILEAAEQYQSSG